MSRTTLGKLPREAMRMLGTPRLPQDISPGASVAKLGPRDYKSRP